MSYWWTKCRPVIQHCRVFSTVKHNSTSNGKQYVHLIHHDTPLFVSKNASTTTDSSAVSAASNSKTSNDIAQKSAENMTKIGAVVNLLLAASKGAVGVAINSTGLIADAASSLGDILTDSVVYFSVQQARKSATPEKPWGHGKFEPLGALIVGGLLMFTGGGIGYSASMSAIALVTDAAQAAEAAATTHLMDATMLSAISVSLFSMIAKELLFRHTLKSGLAANSAVVIANAWQHRSDVFVSGAVCAGVVSSMMGFPVLDPLAGVLVSGVILKQGAVTSIEAIRDLSDTPADEQETAALIASCMSVPGILEVRKLQARRSGPYVYVECTAMVRKNITASAAHRLAELVRTQLMRDHSDRVADAIVHTEPLGAAGLGQSLPCEISRDHDHMSRIVVETAMGIDGICGVSDVQVYYKDDGSVGIKVDVVMDPALRIYEANNLARKVRRKIGHALPSGVYELDIDLELDEMSEDEGSSSDDDSGNENEKAGDRVVSDKDDRRNNG